MRYSLAVKVKKRAEEVLGSLYDPGSPFCVYEPGEDVPGGKFLIVISGKALDLPNAVFYVPDVSVLVKEKQIISTGFPEEEEETELHTERRAVSQEKPYSKEEKQKIPVEEDLFAVERKRDKIVQPEKKEVKKTEKSNVLLVGDVQTALTVAVSVHKLKPFMKVVIEDRELAEQYGVIDQNLVAVPENGQGGVVIKVKAGENSGLEQYKGQQYSNWEEIARRALSRIR